MSRRAARAPLARGLAAAAAAAAAAAVLAGCSSSSSEAAPPPTAQLVRVGNVDSVVLTSLGASRIAVETAAARPAAKGTDITVPAGALLYEPNGNAVVYVNTGRLTYTRHIVPVDFISGNTVYLKAGSLPSGTMVVTQGAAELLGVQNGVGEET